MDGPSRPPQSATPAQPTGTGDEADRRLYLDLDFDDKNSATLIGCLYVYTNELVSLEVLHSKRIEVLD